MTRRARMLLADARNRMTVRDDRGQTTVFVIGVFAAVWLFAGIVVDGGLALAGKAHALDVAEEAARTGAQQLDVGRLRRTGESHLSADQAAAAARAYVAATGDSGTVLVRGGSVTVRVVHHQRTQVLWIVGVHGLTVHATGTAHAEPGTP